MSEQAKQKIIELQEKYGWDYDDCVKAFEFVEDFSRILVKDMEENEPYATSTINRYKAVDDEMINFISELNDVYDESENVN